MIFFQRRKHYISQPLAMRKPLARAVKRSRKVASVRIHVERAIRRMKTFKIISGIVALKLRHCLYQILNIIVVFCNLQELLVKDRTNKNNNNNNKKKKKKKKKKSGTKIRQQNYGIYRIYPKYWNTLSTTIFALKFEIVHSFTS